MNGRTCKTWLALSVLALAGCGGDPVAAPTPVAVASPPTTCVFNITFNGDGTLNLNGCANNTITNPSPSPSPGQAGSGTTDVKGLGQFLYGYDKAGASCTPPAEGKKVLPSGAFDVPVACIADITATPFTDKDLDLDGKIDYAKDTSRKLTWKITGPAVLLPGINGEPLFNQRVLPTGTGIVTVTATYEDSAGGRWTAERNYSVNG